MVPHTGGCLAFFVDEVAEVYEKYFSSPDSDMKALTKE
jgi:hypothetical protein